MSALQDNINSIRNSLKDIRTKLNSKGAGIVEGDDLNTWDDKINDMPDTHVYGPPTGTNEFYRYFRYVDKFEMPTQDPDGNSYSTALGPDSIFWTKAAEFKIPSHYTSLNFSNASGYYNKTACKKITYLGLFASNVGILLSSTPQLELLNLPNATTVSGLYYNNTNYDTIGKCVINLNSYTGTIFGGSGQSASRAKEIELNAPMVESISSLSSNYGYAWYGTYGKLNLTGLKTLTCGSQSIGGTNTDKTQSWYLPSLQSFSTSASVYPWYTPLGGHVDLYLGGNVATFSISNSSALTSFKSAITSEIITIHIPAGDSTTKTTLDTAGIEYVQDYNI